MYSKYYTENGDNIKFDLEFSTVEELDRWRRTLYTAQRPRRIAGSKRVERYLERERDCNKGSGQGLLLQSITAHPALSTRSFEV